MVNVTHVIDQYELAHRPLRIVVADDHSDALDLQSVILEKLGHEVVGLANDGREFVRMCVEMTPDLAIADIRMPEMDGIQAADELARLAPMPIILVSGCYDERILVRAGLTNVMAYLVKPISPDGLRASIANAMRRFDELSKLREEAHSLRQALRDRKVIERAKVLIMKRAGLSESEAFRRLQRLSWNKNQKLTKIAETIILAEEAAYSDGHA